MDRRTSGANWVRKKKTTNACQWCRTRKMKCSGQQPCSYCASRQLQCVFAEKHKKVTVTQEYLDDLQARASGGFSLASQRPNEGPESSGAIHAAFPGSMLTSEITEGPQQQEPHAQLQQGILSPESLQAVGRPFNRTAPMGDSECPQFMGSTYSGIQRNDTPEAVESSDETQSAAGDQFRRYGHSSSWAFSRKVRTMLAAKLNKPPLHDLVPIRDGAYGIPWRVRNLDLSGVELPTQEYAEYLINTVYFYFDSLYYLFDKAAVLTRLADFYSTDIDYIEHYTQLWHLQLIVIFAIGKSILARGAEKSGPVGALLFSRAVEAFPDNHRFYQDPTLSIEILILFALFMQAMDLRLAAQQYICQAARICYTHGHHREFEPSVHTHAEFKHRSQLWWTVYVIERKLASLAGVPPTLHDKDLCLAMPSLDTPNTKELYMALHIDISSQLGQILTVVYGPGSRRQLGGQFISAIQGILQRLATTSITLEARMGLDLHNPAAHIAASPARLHLLYHQCAIFAIRPVLFSLIKRKFRPGETRFELSEAVIGLLRVCVESSLQVLRIVESLNEHKLMDYLLPYDLDFMFVAAFALLTTDIISPNTPEPWDIARTFRLFDDFILLGIAFASPYKKDLEELNDFRISLRRQEHQEQGQHMQQREQQSRESTLQDIGDPSNYNIVPGMVNPRQGHHTSYPHLYQDLIWPWRHMDNGAVLHRDTIQSAIHGLNFDFTNNQSIDLDGAEWM